MIWPKYKLIPEAQLMAKNAAVRSIMYLLSTLRAEISKQYKVGKDSIE